MGATLFPAHEGHALPHGLAHAEAKSCGTCNCLRAALALPPPWGRWRPKAQAQTWPGRAESPEAPDACTWAALEAGFSCG